MKVKIKYIPKVYDFFENNKNAEYYIIAGGRGKGATWAIGNEIILRVMSKKHFCLCTREISGTIDHSSRRTIEELIRNLGLENYFEFQATKTICNITGSTIIYSGLSKLTENNVQGLEGLTLAWLGEAHTMALSTWQKFEPTVRDNLAIVFIDYNIQESITPIHTLFTENPTSYPFEGKRDMPEIAYLFMNYKDNIFCPEKTIRMANRHKRIYSLNDWEWMWLGKLRDASEKYVCDDREVQMAMDRDIEVDETELLVVGCDIAHLGGDEIIFYKRRGMKFLDNGRRMTMKKTPETCNELEAYVNYEKGAVLVIDNGHVGAAVADMMELRGYYVERINFGGVKEMHKDPKHSKDCATDMAFNFKAMLPELDLPNDPVLKNQVIQRKWTFLNNKGVRKIESKDEFKKHATNLEGHKSPDRGDAAWLCCYNSKSMVLSTRAGSILGVY